MANSWARDREVFIEPLLRAIDGDGGTFGRCQLAAVFFATATPFSAALLERSHWSEDVADARAWLDGLPLSGCGHADSALAEALAEALYMLQSAADAASSPGSAEPSGTTNEQVFLVTRSEPHRLAVPGPVALDSGLQPPPTATPGRGTFGEMMGLLRDRGVGLSVLAGGPMTSYQWLVRMAVSTAMPKGEVAPAGKEAQQEVFARMTVSAGRESTVLVSPRWPAALDLLKAQAAERRALKAAAAAPQQLGQQQQQQQPQPQQNRTSDSNAASAPGLNPAASQIGVSTGPQATTEASKQLPPLAAVALQAASLPTGGPQVLPSSSSGLQAMLAPSPAGPSAGSPAYWAPSPVQSVASPGPLQMQPPSAANGPGYGPPGQGFQSDAPSQQYETAPPPLQQHQAGTQPPQQYAAAAASPGLHQGAPQQQHAYTAASPGQQYATSSLQPSLQSQPPWPPQQLPRQQVMQQQQQQQQSQQLPPGPFPTPQQQQAAPGPASAMMPSIPMPGGLQQQQRQPQPSGQPSPMRAPVRGTVVWEGDLLFSGKSSRPEPDVPLAPVRCLVGPTWPPGLSTGWPHALRVHKISPAKPLMAALAAQMRAAHRCALVMTAPLQPDRVRGHKVLQELAEKALTAWALVPGHVLVMHLALKQLAPQQPGAFPLGQQPPQPQTALSISGFMIPNDQMPS